MQVDLRMKKVKKRSVIKTAILDAIIWYWLHQVSYESLFTQQIGGVPASGWVSVFMSFAVGLGIVLAKWNQIPALFCTCAAFAASLSSLLLLLVGQIFPTAFSIRVAALPLLVAAVCVCQILRLENLAKCEDIRTLTAAMASSLFLYYVFSFVLVSLPKVVYCAFAVLAPLSLLIGGRDTLKLTERIGRISKKTFFSTPNLLVILFSIIGGFVFASGNITSATIINDILTAPPPSYLLMLILYMELGVIVSFGLNVKKAMYFVLMNITWMLGSLLGNFVSLFIPIPSSSLLAIASAFIVASFFLFQSTWLNGTKYVISQSNAAEKLAHDEKLSKRETEVVLLLLEGRNLKFIQNKLFISEGTARTHVRRIYSKLNIHSKQELIDFFEEHMGKGLRKE